MFSGIILKKIENILGKNKMKDAIYLLAYFDPFFKDDYGCQIIDYLVLDALKEYGQLLTSTALDVKTYIKEIYKLDFEEAEIIESCKRLFKKDQIEFNESKINVRPTFKIKKEYKEEIQRNIIKAQDLEKLVLDDWKEQILNKYNDIKIIIENISKIVENLQKFIRNIYFKHGIECVALLYPDEKKSQEWIRSNKDSIVDCLDKIDPFIDNILKIELLSFFKNADENRKQYIEMLFNSSFIWHLIQIDDECSALLKIVTRGQRLFLDNNILYSLVGLHGSFLLQSIHTMLKIANSLGYELWVTTKTIDEFQNSLIWQRKEHKTLDLIPSHLAKIALDNLDEDSFIKSYWKEYVENGTNIEEFVTEKSHIENILSGYNISIYKKYRNEIENSEELKLEISKLRTFTDNKYSDQIYEHDAFHRILINKTRDGKKYKFSDAKTWFLTQDSKLPGYDRFAREEYKSLPFCLTSDQWVQINRPFLARTTNQKDYNESYYYIVTQPYILSLMRSFSLSNVYKEILGKISRYKNMNQEIALKIITDTSFVISTSLESDEMKKDEMIENEFLKLTERLEDENKLLKLNQKQLEEKVITLERSINKNEEKSNNLENKLEQEIIDRRKTEEDLDIANIDRTNYREKLDELISDKNNIKNWSIYGWIVLILSICLWILPLLINLKYLNQHEKSLHIKIMVQILIILTFLIIPLKEYILKNLLTWIGSIIICIIAILTFM